MEHVLSGLGSGWPSFMMVVTFLVLVATLVATTLGSVENRILGQTGAQLAALARGLQGAHTLWADGRRSDLRTLTASPTLVDGLLMLQESPGDESAKRLIRRRLAAHVDAFDFPSSCAMLSREGEPIVTAGSASGRATSFAAAYPQHFERARRGLAEIVLARAEGASALTQTKIEAIAAAPVIDADGMTLGIAVWEFDPASGLAVISALGRVARTSRAFVFDSQGQVVVNYGGEAGDMGVSAGRSALIAHTLAGQPGTILEQYPDPSGTMVIGSSLWDENLDLGIGAELSHDEAFGGYFELRNIIIGSVITMAALSLALLAILGMARARVVRGLESSRARLEQIVDERTSALAEMNRELRLEAERRMRHAWELEMAREALEAANRKLEIIASRDVLTGLANRRAFEIALEREWQRAMRSGTPLGLLMIDVDDFKTLNDTQGHPAGDDALRRIGATLRSLGFARRPGDLICRVGGEEFAVLLEDATIERAEDVAEQVRVAILEERIEHEATRVDGLEVVSVSVGAAAIVPSSGEDPDFVVALADKALYRAKNEGRNRVAVSRVDESGDAGRRRRDWPQGDPTPEA